MTPSDPTDVGEPEPALAAALAAGDADVVCALLPAARLLVPVVAMPTGSADVGGEAGGEAEMAVAVLVNESGQRGLPVFTCVAALQEWRRDARPVPMTGSRVMAAAVSEGYDGVVIDVAGPVTFTLKPDDLRRLLA